MNEMQGRPKRLTPGRLREKDWEYLGLANYLLLPTSAEKLNEAAREGGAKI
jgi:hypothetical protein